MLSFCSFFNITFSALSDGYNLYDYQLNQAFYDSFNFEQEFRSPELKALVSVTKSDHMLELNIELNGKIELICDLTAKAFNYLVNHKMKLLIKF